MPLLRMREASFASAGATAGPVSVDVMPGDRVALSFERAREAAVVARLAAGIVKASGGVVLISDYDPRVQSVHCKRIAGFVQHEPLMLDDAEFSGYVGYRAALWNVDERVAQAYASELRERLRGMHEAFAYPLIGALICRPKLLVLDRPAPVYAEQLYSVAAEITVLSTHCDAADARAFAKTSHVQV